jgi:hypothetical protein
MNCPSNRGKSSSCATTADFVAAAQTTATSNHPPAAAGTIVGTYVLISTTTPRTAYIQVSFQGVFSLPTHEYHWVQIGAVPIDSTGTSIASETESSQESFYGALDQTLFGANRAAPTTITMPSNYSASFIGSEDGETSPGIGYALFLMGINPAEIPVGTTITVTFTSDGTTAQFVKQSATATYQWLWNGIAHNKAGQRINRAGGVISNPNTAGLGGGSGTAPVWNPGSSWVFTGGNDCFFSGYVTLPDGSTFGSSGWGPC